MESFETQYKPSEPGSATKIRAYVVAATINLLQAKLLLARQRRDPQTCQPLLGGRIEAVAPIVDELLRLGTSLRRDTDPVPSDDPEHIGNIAQRELAAWDALRNARPR